ncbi:hypothetical protein [Phenylobacterium sp.]|uniref:hypothetical protein n=1 Tax=Phenylobacterium sp. TaxID=1871053 RepID=UPI002811DDAA|nr:hypothetical protein [Phenylobacterium sp.]
MARIFYLLFSNGGLTGGHKMLLRQVETLRDLGFDACAMLGPTSKAPRGVSHRAPIISPQAPAPDDIIVIPEEAHEAMRLNQQRPERSVVLIQSWSILSEVGFQGLDSFGAGATPPLLVASPGLRDLMRRLYPEAQIELVPCFADERLFRPSAKTDAVACAPSKRERELQMIHNLFRRLHPRHARLPWGLLRTAPEEKVASMFAQSSLHLGLGRLESVGLVTLEALASGCVCAGFTGVGGREYATADNGFWVADDDCVAAADALAAAADLVRTGGAALSARVEAGQETARQWSYARFRAALEDAWMRLAPEARLRNGPLEL